MSRPILKCPHCKSKKVKKPFLAIPRVFGCAPALIALIWLVGGISAIINGLSIRGARGHKPGDWITYVVAGGVVSLIAVLGLLSKSHKCLACGRRFNWPTLITRKFTVACPQCGAQMKGMSEDLVGETAACPECKHTFEVQEP